MDAQICKLCGEEGHDESALHWTCDLKLVVGNLPSVLKYEEADTPSTITTPS